MNLLDKLKNALFEEEYVEVEEKKEIKKEPKKKEKPIAKKIILDEPTPKKEEKKEDVIIEEEKPKITNDNKDFKFKAILDDDFIDLDNKKEEQSLPKVKSVKREEKKESNFYKEEKEEERKVYGTTPSSLNKEIKIHEYGSATKQKEKKEFHPSPIISPIYGVLDQNYKKDDIVTKKEVRITSSYKKKNIDVDSVRAKAYGNSDDIFEEELTSNKKEIEQEKNDEVNDIKEEDSLLDISTDNTPSVSKVTIGDAEEYFSDLGLEYNIDYKDTSHEKATGRRTDLRNFDEDDLKKDDTSIEDNLFDLIDSMYDEKKGE